jgi:hypothetical protein
MSTIKQLKTLSTKDLGYTAKEIRKLVEDKGSEKVFIARIGGVATGTIKGESKHGDWVGFKGLFFAVNAKNERFSSETAFLPSNLAKDLDAQFEVGVLQINLPSADIFVVESDKNASGYAYHCGYTMTEEHIKRADAIAASVFNTKLPTMLEASKEETKAEAKTEAKKPSGKAA